MKKRKLKKNVKKTFVVIICAIAIFTFLFIYNSTDRKLSRLNYSKEAIREIKKNKIEKTVLDNKYSKTLEVALNTDNFKKKNLDDYLCIKYNSKNTVIQVNSLKEAGYNTSEMKKIFEKLQDEEIDFLTNYTYIDNLKSYLDYKIFKVQNLERYIKYRDSNTDENLNYKDIILKVNMDLDKEYYDNPKTIENPNDLLVLVNKYNKLPDDYEAKDLELIDSKYSVSQMKLNKTAKEHFEEMCTDAKSINLYIKAVSAYRTKEYQSKLYNDYVNSNGRKYAENYSARPRHSEHETGLAVDVKGGLNGYTLFENTEEYKWVLQNAQKYGFIVRYQKEKENITGYKYESWHLRYVGKDVAEYIHKKGITFDEYYAIFLDK